MDDKYHGMNGNAIRRPRETGSRSGAMEANHLKKKTAPDDDDDDADNDDDTTG